MKIYYLKRFTYVPTILLWMHNLYLENVVFLLAVEVSLRGLHFSSVCLLLGIESLKPIGHPRFKCALEDSFGIIFTGFSSGY